MNVSSHVAAKAKRSDGDVLVRLSNVSLRSLSRLERQINAKRNSNTDRPVNIAEHFAAKRKAAT